MKVLKQVSIFLILLMFFLSGFGKIKNFQLVSEGLQDKLSKKLFLDLPLWFAKIAIILVILLEIGAPSLIFYSGQTGKYKNYSRFSLYLLIAFLILATYLYHFPPLKSQYYPFIANVSTLGALLLLTQFF